jgi:pilus assembly protein Flp/PilA
MNLEGGLQMTTLANRVRTFLVSEDGPTAVEYAVMLALILVACIVMVQTLGTSVATTFTDVNTQINATKPAP